MPTTITFTTTAAQDAALAKGAAAHNAVPTLPPSAPITPADFFGTQVTAWLDGLVGADKRAEAADAVVIRERFELADEVTRAKIRTDLGLTATVR